MTTLEECLPGGLAERLSGRCVSALKRAYALNLERYDETVGDDRLTFGVAVWRNSWFLIETEVASISEFETARPDGSLVIRVGQVQIHAYKVGETEHKNIHDVRIQGTATKNRIVQGNAAQLQLFDLTAIGGPSNLVLAHLGNPFDGLCAAYIGAPTEAEDGPSWHWVERIYRIAPDEVRRPSETLPEGPITLYSDLPVPDLDLSLKPVQEVNPRPDES